jgi:pantoate--beta-alanine ligase
MGCLHAGHLSLVQEAGRRADLVVVSIFVNPAQFGPNEDFDLYPRTFDDDCQAVKKAGAAVLFAPGAGEMYSPEYQSSIHVDRVSQGLCSASRPGHFDGVATVVAKLFNLVSPHFAIFGEKDFQQLAVIRAMVRDLNFNLEIIGHPIVREEDGLAMSSRNRYLGQSERKSALCLYHALQNSRRLVRNGEINCQNLLTSVKDNFAKDPLVTMDYVNIVDDKTLAGQDEVNKTSVLAMAIKIGKTRLIDNGYLVSHVR